MPEIQMEDDPWPNDPSLLDPRHRRARHPHEGPLRQPKFGPLPPLKRVSARRHVIFKYANILEQCREHPNQSAMIGVYEVGAPSVTRKQVMTAKARIDNWLYKHYPLEAWRINTRSAADSWNRREIWATYFGALTPDQMEELRRLRKDIWTKHLMRGPGREANNVEQEKLLHKAVPAYFPPPHIR